MVTLVSILRHRGVRGRAREKQPAKSITSFLNIHLDPVSTPEVCRPNQVPSAIYHGHALF